MHCIELISKRNDYEQFTIFVIRQIANIGWKMENER